MTCSSNPFDQIDKILVPVNLNSNYNPQSDYRPSIYSIVVARMETYTDIFWVWIDPEYDSLWLHQ